MAGIHRDRVGPDATAILNGRMLRSQPDPARTRERPGPAMIKTTLRDSTAGLETTLAEAARRAASFSRLVDGLPYEAKGVLTSEMLFLVAAVGGHRPGRIVESGRARGQSTLLLGLAFPDVSVISIERDQVEPRRSGCRGTLQRASRTSTSCSAMHAKNCHAGSVPATSS